MFSTIFNKVCQAGLLLTLMITSGYALATPAKPATVQQLISETKMQQTIEQALQQLKPVVDQQILIEAQTKLGQQTLTTQQLEIVQQMQQLTWQQISQSNNWQNVQQLMLTIYQKHFSEEELQATLRFYRSPEGRSMLEKTPLIMQDIVHNIMQNLQNNLQQILPSAETAARLTALQDALTGTAAKTNP